MELKGIKLEPKFGDKGSSLAPLWLVSWSALALLGIFLFMKGLWAETPQLQERRFLGLSLFASAAFAWHLRALLPRVAEDDHPRNLPGFRIVKQALASMGKSPGDGNLNWPLAFTPLAMIGVMVLPLLAVEGAALWLGLFTLFCFFVWELLVQYPRVKFARMLLRAPHLQQEGSWGSVVGKASHAKNNRFMLEPEGAPTLEINYQKARWAFPGRREMDQLEDVLSSGQRELWVAGWFTPGKLSADGEAPLLIFVSEGEVRRELRYRYHCCWAFLLVLSLSLLLSFI